MIFALYADDSSDHRGEIVLCAGALFGWPSSIFDIECKWQKRLDRDNIGYFRSSDWESLRGEFDISKHGNLNTARATADSVRHDLLEIVLSSGGGAGGLSVSMLLKDFHKVVSSNEKARGYYGTDAATATYKILIKDVIKMLNRDWPENSTPIAFTFDSHTKYLEAEKAYNDLRKDPFYAERMGAVDHADDKRRPPLQIADMMASVARYQALDWMEGKAAQRSTFQALTDANLFYFSGIIGEEELLKDLPE
jgi:uncharacterized protein DUF3800